MFVWQSLIVVLLIIAAGVGNVLQTRRDSEGNARSRSLGVAAAFAHAPGTAAALRSPDPTAVLQPLAEETRRDSGVDFVSVLSRSGVRYTDPLPQLIGRRASGNWRRALSGTSFTEKFTGAPTEAIRAAVPVTDSRGEVVGVVTAGVEIATVSEAVNRELPLLLGVAAAALALALGGAALVSRRLRRQTHGLGPAEVTRMYEHHDAVLHAVREGVLVIGAEGQLLLANDEARRLLELPADASKADVRDLGLADDLTALLASHRTVTDEVFRSRGRLLAVSCRPTGRPREQSGCVATLRDTTELRALAGRVGVARERLQLLHDAGMRIGSTLDVTRTAQELAQVAVPRLADAVTIDLLEPVLRGEELSARQESRMRRAAAAQIPGLPPLPWLDPPNTPPTEGTWGHTHPDRRSEIITDLLDDSRWRDSAQQGAETILGLGLRSLLTAPILAGGTALGVARFWRTGDRAPFDSGDLSAAEELVTRTAVCIDNARRFTREHAVAEALQRSLLPGGVPEQNSVEVAYRYVPAEAGVRGDWFDVIPLPGGRVALVVGDVVGHGLHAAATMGRLRTAVHNFAGLDLPPDDMLSHLDELIARIDQDQRTNGETTDVTGATALYAVYDSASGLCTLARAGHPPPAVVGADGTVTFPEVPAGPPLGLAQLPFEASELVLPEGSSLVLYTDGLIRGRTRQVDDGMDLLSSALSHPGRTPEQTCADVCTELVPDRPTDDIALLVARARRLPADRIAEWQVPDDPAAVAPVREAVTRQLAAWGLEESGFTTELILSELITNAIRYGTPPIAVRLLLDHVLTCEVSDTSSSAPHLRYAATTDEGGRGLYLVAHLAERWGTRYTPNGKVIWTEQLLPTPLENGGTWSS